jgi:alpha-amylase
MVKRCNAVGVRIYVDVVINQMAAPISGQNDTVVGTGGSIADPANRNFSAVPYTKENFHSGCALNNYQNPDEVRNCDLVGLPDLNQTDEHVRDEVVSFMNKLIDYGVAGFRMDACKHMLPDDLKVIYQRLNFLNTNFGFLSFARPFIYQEVIDLGNERITK